MLLRSDFMKRLKIVVLLLFGSAFLAVFCGCALPEEMLRYQPGSTESVKIGLVLPLSGADASQGRKMFNGARFAAEEINSKRGHFGRQVELIVEDSRSSGPGAAAAFEKVVKSGAVGVVGAYSTTEARHMTGLARRFRVPLVIAMATGNDEVIGGNRFVFRSVFTDKQQARMIAGYMKYFRRVKRIVVTVSADPGDLYSRNVARDVTRAFRDLGGQVVAVSEINKKFPDKLLQEAVALAPDAIVLPFRAAEAARYYKILRKNGYVGLICGPDSWDDPEFTKALQGLKKTGVNFYTAFFSTETRHWEFSQFWENFRKKSFYYPDSCEIQTFDAVNMLLIGLGNNARNLRLFQKNWQGMRKHVGAAAVYTMKPKNEIDRTIHINRIGVDRESGDKFVSRNLVSLQYSRLEDYNAVSKDKDEEE